MHASGLRIDGIWSRSAGHAEKLASGMNCNWGSIDKPLPSDSSYYLIAVSDSAISAVADRFSGHPGIWIHTAGALDMEVLARSFNSYGVLYPLQTFSIKRNIEIKQVPFLVEGSDPETLASIRTLASLLTKRVLEMNSTHRLLVHLSLIHI